MQVLIETIEEGGRATAMMLGVTVSLLSSQKTGVNLGKPEQVPKLPALDCI